MTKQLQKDGYNVGKKFVKKAMKYMGIEALYTKPKTTTANKEHYKYSYLLKDFRDYAGRVVTERANQVWSTDITYIKLETGFVYLAAIIDWHSKKILSWKLIMYPKIKTSKSNILISPLYDTSGNGFTPFASKLLSA